MTGSKRVFSRSGMSLASVAALLALAACGGGGGERGQMEAVHGDQDLRRMAQ